jgi:integrase
VPRREKGSGSVYEDPKRPGRYIGEVKIHGKRRRVSGKNKTEVRAKLSALVAKRETGAPIDDRQYTVSDAINTFLERELPNRRSNGRPLAPGTVHNYRFNLRLVEKEIGTAKLASLTVEDVEAMLDRLAARSKRPLSQASLRKLLSMFASVIGFAERRGRINRNVAKLATIPPQARRTVPRRSLSPEDARTLLTALRQERNGAMFALSLRLGLRPGEAAGLHWSDVRLKDDPVINVTRAVQRDGARVAVVDDLKTSSSKRTIGLPADLADWLREHRAEQRRERAAAEVWVDPQLVFASATGRVLEPKNTRKRFANICAKLDERDEAGEVVREFPRIAPNELRHSCASLLSDEGVSHEAIADLLGHVDTRMVDRTYRHRLRPVVDVAARATWAVGNWT